jgi:ABC-type transporter Mla subunit MlaD
MADATITAVAQELRETNEGIADVSTNTSEMVPYLDYSMNMNEGIHQKLTELISLMSSNFAQDDKENKNLFGSLRDSFSEKLNELIKFMRGDELQKLEDKREEKPPEVREFPNQEQSNDLIQELISKLSGVFEAVADTLKILLAPFAVIIGTIIGTFKGYIDSVKAIGLTVSNIVKVLTRGAVDLQKIFSNIRAVISAFANVPGNLIRSLTNVSGPIQGISKFFAAVKTQLSTATKAVKSVLLPITQSISNSVRIISSAFKSVTDALGPIGKVLGNIGGLLRGTVQVVRSFVPFLNFFFVGFETIKGIFKGFKEGGILGALEGVTALLQYRLIF